MLEREIQAAADRAQVMGEDRPEEEDQEMLGDEIRNGAHNTPVDPAVQCGCGGIQRTYKGLPLAGRNVYHLLLQQ